MASIYAYLEGQTADDLYDLYESPWCCMAVFQSLPSMARHIVMRFLCIRTPVAESFIRCWYKDTRPVLQELDAALAKLTNLYILGRPPGELISSLGLNGTEETAQALSVNLRFAESLQRALSNTESTPWEDLSKLTPPLLHPPSVKTIESVAGAKWNAILHFLVGTADAPMPEPSVVQLLVATGLVAPGQGGEAGTANGEGARDENGGVLTVDALPGGRKRKRVTILTWDQIIEAGGGEVHVTREGYGFLLRSTSMQLWTFLDQYVRTAPARGQKTTDILALLFELGYTRRGQGYSVAAFHDEARPDRIQVYQTILDDFAAFGLVYIPEDQRLDLPPGESEEDFEGMETTRFYPTYLAITLTQVESGGGGAAGGGGQAAGDEGSSAPADDAKDAPPSALDAAVLASSAFSDAASGGVLQLMVESNFKVYGYSRAGLHTTLLALFASIECLLPNLVVSTVTRRSVMAAYDKGITAEQIVGFLRLHLHPAMRARGMGVPENVAGQLVLWQRERHRVAYRGAVLITGFVTIAQFRDAVAFARSLKPSDDDEEGEDPGDGGTTGGKAAPAPAQPAPGVGKGAMDTALLVPMPDMACGGLLWADETKLLICLRDGDFAEAVRLHMKAPAIRKNQ